MAKTIQFQGRQLEVPEWAKWVAQDGDGSIYAYESKPRKDGDFWLLMSGTERLEKVFGGVAPMVLKEIE